LAVLLGLEICNKLSCGLGDVQLKHALL
jgi:hypothetical protein